jgi:Na+-translocating ferredoxin:NAD+ oxidoreductase RnfC subunit
MNLIEKVKSAGIVGAGGAGFPTDVKLNAKAEYFILNAAECEPLIETDKYLCREFADEVVAGTVMAAEQIGATKIVFAIKGKYKAEIAALEAAIKKAGAKIEISKMPTFYPAGDEQTIVEFVTGRVVPERGLPLNVGTVVNNVGTMLNLYEAVTQDKPVIDKYLSITGEVAKTIMLNVPIGTSLRECIEKADPLIKDYAIIVGGPMMGQVISDKEGIDKAVVTKTTGNVIVLSPTHYLVTWAADPIEKKCLYSVPHVYRSLSSLSVGT